MTKPGTIHKEIIALLSEAPGGLTMGEIREKLGKAPDAQAQLDRRKRDLHKWYLIETRKEGRATRHVLLGPRETPLPAKAVSSKLRAEVLGAARGKCGMCGKTITRHGVTLVVDHKVPQAWGGTSDKENLWAICDECNGGKKAHFSSLDQEKMREVMRHQTSHERIAAAFLTYGGAPVPSNVLEIAGGEVDWRKRLRELRYLGWEITSQRNKTSNGSIEVRWEATKHGEWFEGMGKKIRAIERDRKQKKAGKLNSS